MPDKLHVTMEEMFYFTQSETPILRIAQKSYIGSKKQAKQRKQKHNDRSAYMRL